MSDAIPSLMKILPMATQGMGAISNIVRGNRVNSAQKAAQQKQQELQKLIANPALLAAKARALQQPLNQGLVQGVENQAQGGLAERGLGTSPQIANEVFAQALGPYEHQNQMEALRSVLQMYGMEDTAINTFLGAEGQPVDTSGLWGAMQKQGQQPWTNNNPNQLPSGGGGGSAPQPSITLPGAGGGMPPDLGPYGTGNPVPGGFPGTDDIWGDMP